MTRLSNSIFQYLSMPISSSYWQKTFYMLSVLLIGFLSGALFGTILPFIRSLFFWDGFIIASLLVIIECLSYFSYKPRQLNKSKDWKRQVIYQQAFLQRYAQQSFLQNRNKQKKGLEKSGSLVPWLHERNFDESKSGIRSYTEKSYAIKGLSFFKIGLMIGFFVDAFKVGS